MQMTKGLLAVGLAIGLGVLGSNANAMTLHTGPAWAEGGAFFSGLTYHACNVANVSNTAITDLQVVLHRADGTVLKTSGVTTLGPGQVIEVESQATGYQGFARCRIYSPTATGSQLRGNITVFRWVGTYYESMATEHAR